MTLVSKRIVFPVFVVVVLVLAAGWRTAAWNSRGEEEIVGTWQVTVQLTNCSGVNLGNPFPSLLTFENGGTFIEDTMNPGFAPGQRGPGHGIWDYQGHHSYSAKHVAFINFTTPPAPPASPGFNAGTQTITQTIDFDHGPDQWSASGAMVQFADTTGTVYRQACADATAARLE